LFSDAWGDYAIHEEKQQLGKWKYQRAQKSASQLGISGAPSSL
jgi:hypothetical protein